MNRKVIITRAQLALEWMAEQGISASLSSLSMEHFALEVQTCQVLTEAVETLFQMWPNVEFVTRNTSHGFNEIVVHFRMDPSGVCNG